MLLTALALRAQQLVIVSTADLHGETAAFARLAPVICAAKPDLLIDAGDLFSGNYTTTADGGASMVAALNQLHYDAWIPGNHDFDLSVGNVGKLAAAFSGATLGNWHSPDVPGVKPWLLLEIKNLRVFVIGCGVPDQQQRLIPDGKFTQHSYDDALSQGIAAARKENADLIVLAAHRGVFGKDGNFSDLLSRHPGIDLVLGSHTHQGSRGENLGNSYYLQSNAHAKNAACAVVTFDPETRKITQIESSLISAAAAPDAALEKIFAEAEKAAHFKGDQPEITLSAPLRLPEPGNFDCGFVRLAAEAMRNAAQCDAAIYDGFADHREVAGKLTPRRLFALAPYSGNIVVCRLTREEVRGVMEEIFSSMPLKKPGPVPGFAGIAYRLKHKKIADLQIPDELDVALGCYRFCRSKALAELRSDSRRWRDTGISERDAIWQEIFRRNQK
ncbi:MAG: metallophosphoesterase [Victivallaceae bacterium]|nr:metallophosphoesterase [Victivallaceae bacterium]